MLLQLQFSSKLWKSIDIVPSQKRFFFLAKYLLKNSGNRSFSSKNDVESAPAAFASGFWGMSFVEALSQKIVKENVIKKFTRKPTYQAVDYDNYAEKNNGIAGYHF